MPSSGSRAVATPESHATAAAEEAFRAGGNAIDAALAAAAVLTVTYPHNCALGGDLFALVRSPDGRVVSVNASGPAPRAVDPSALRRKADAIPVLGADAVTVPGLVAGWEELHRRGATLPWEDLLAAAIELAEDGVEVSTGLAGAIAQAPALDHDPGMAATFTAGGQPLRAGDTIRQPPLAATLGRLAADGPRSFYEGPVAAELIGTLSRRGSALAEADLREFRPEVTAPLAGIFNGLEILTSPPNSSGILVLQALASLEAGGIADPLGEDAGVVAELFRIGDEDRARLLADPRAVPFDRDAWLGEERIAAAVARARAVAGGAAVPALRHRARRPAGDTAAVVAVDGDGRAVSLIQSLFHWFGAQILDPATGVLLHNRGAAFSLRGDRPNTLAPGRRPPHTLMPIMAQRDGVLAGVLGTMGGRVHAQIHVQVLARLLAGDVAQAAVDAPRWIAGAMDLGQREDTVHIEAGCDETTRTALARADSDQTTVERGSDVLGHAQAIWLEPTLSAGSDCRADGATAIL
jgi:gamma-glutamyltranspeptidase